MWRVTVAAGSVRPLGSKSSSLSEQRCWILDNVLAGLKDSSLLEQRAHCLCWAQRVVACRSSKRPLALASLVTCPPPPTHKHTDGRAPNNVHAQSSTSMATQRPHHAENRTKSIDKTTWAPPHHQYFTNRQTPHARVRARTRHNHAHKRENTHAHTH